MILLVKRDQNTNADSLSKLEALFALRERQLAEKLAGAFGAFKVATLAA